MTKQKKFKITKIASDYVYLKGNKGSLKVPTSKFIESFFRVDQNTAVEKKEYAAN